MRYFVVLSVLVVSACVDMGPDYGCWDAFNRRDYTHARAVCSAAAEQGLAAAQNNLGVMYSLGQGVAHDNKEAVNWFRKAAKQGSAAAQNNLGLMYRDEKGVKQNDAEAVAWFRRSAEQDYMWAQNNLGLMYSLGRGVKKNNTEAVKWYRKAAEQGHAAAQFSLGIKFRDGKGVKQNDAEAVAWFRSSAEQGYLPAQRNLGLMYSLGRGVALGQMYRDAGGVERDYVMAHMLFDIAAAQGDKKGAKYRDLVAERMPSADILRAQHLARDCVEKNYKGCF